MERLRRLRGELLLLRRLDEALAGVLGLLPERLQVRPDAVAGPLVEELPRHRVAHVLQRRHPLGDDPLHAVHDPPAGREDAFESWLEQNLAVLANEGFPVRLVDQDSDLVRGRQHRLTRRLRPDLICRFTEDGNLVVEGRDKDMINRGGEKVSAEEIENLVYRLPAVSQVAAVAMPDTVLGERVCLYVVPLPGRTVTLEEIRGFMETLGVARFKLPEHLVLVGELVSTKVGKIDKKALRADIAGRLGSGVTA